MAVIRNMRSMLDADSPEMALVRDSSAAETAPVEVTAPEPTDETRARTLQLNTDPAPTGGVAAEAPAAKTIPASIQVQVAPAEPVQTPAAPPAQEVELAAGAQGAPAAETVEEHDSARPHYLKLVRKEMRLFPDQSVDLKILTMQIHNAKYGQGERITDNTLVRVAIDLLLQRKDELHGNTEQELRDSLGLPPRY